MATERNVIICLPGILARSEEQHKPLWLERFGTVEYFDYDPNSFQMDVETARAVSMVKQYSDDGYTVKLLGTSLGGNVAAFVTEQLGQDCPDIDDWFATILVDAPAGSGSFHAARTVPPKLILSPVGRGATRALGAVTAKLNDRGVGIPKDELITRPEPDVMRHMAQRDNFSDEEWKSWVKQTARKALSGHKGVVYSDQIREMTWVFEHGTLARAARSMRPRKVTYVQCTVGNNVVVQPDALNWWLDQIGHHNSDDGETPRWATAKGPHAAYLQMQPELEAAIVPLLK